MVLSRSIVESSAHAAQTVRDARQTEVPKREVRGSSGVTD